MYKGYKVELVSKIIDPENDGVGIFDFALTKDDVTTPYTERMSKFDLQIIKNKIDQIEGPAEEAQRQVDQIQSMSELMETLPLGTIYLN